MPQSESPQGFMIQGSEAHQIAQAVYHSVTGKTEKLIKAFSDNYKITFEDIQQLHAKCGKCVHNGMLLKVTKT